MADVALGFLLEQVTGVIKGYADLISGAGAEFNKLQADVKLLKANLENISSKSSKDHILLKELQDEVRDIIYEVEDTIDSWLTESAALKGTGKVKCFAKWLSPNHFSLANDVKNLRENRVKEMFDKIVKMGSAVETTSKEEPVSPNTDKPVRKEKVVRLIDEERIIIGYLTADTEGLDVIPIIGLPGLGKTTIVSKIFNDERICSAFPKMRIWVQFSQRFNSKNVFVSIMNQINKGNNDVSYKSNEELSRSVYECLKGEKFLLVIDDVWETEHWDDIKDALPMSNGRGKVLITSRNIHVGRYVSRITDPYELRVLDQDESWKLLKFEVFSNLERCPGHLKGIGKHIAKECKGVPLVIMLMGGVLRNHYLKLKKSPVLVKKKWEEMVNVNLALEGDQKEQVILDIVGMSYNSLPDQYLRDCFLYLGVFPEGYEIPSWTLTSLWIAEGFIKPHEKKSLEEVANDYLEELISRNLLMAHKINPMQEVKVCGVHDMIRLFCRTKALAENLFKEIKLLENEVANDTLVSDMQKIRRLCLHSNLSTFFSSKLQGQRVRSFLSFRKGVIDLEQKFNTGIPESFVKLRILQSKSIKFKTFPESITKLAHLRYIVLCVDDLKALPEAISNMWNLQTIIVDTQSDTIKMEANIWKMIRLRHVKTKAAIVLDEKWKGVPEQNLQILNRLSPESATAAFSQKASKLKTLGIRGKLAPLFDNMPLQNLNQLEKLKLYHAVTENDLQSFPDRKCFPPNLKRLTLSNTFLDWKHMHTIAMMVDLEVLKLKNNAFKGISWTVDSNGFKKLEFLQIVTTELVLWEASADAFPSLRHLVLKECMNLNKIPDHVLQRLEYLEIEHVLKSTANSVRNSKFQFKLSVGPGCEK